MRTRISASALAAAVVLILAAPAHANETHHVTYNSPAIGQGDVGGICFNHDPGSIVPPQLSSCIEVPSPRDAYAYVDITVIDNSNNNVFISVDGGGNPNGATGCGTVLNYPLGPEGPGGGPAEPINVFPWPGPAVKPALDAPGIEPCAPGTVDTTGGIASFTFHN